MRTNLFSGEVENTFTIEDMVSMYKIGWRSLEGCTLHPAQWATNDELNKVAFAHVHTLLRQKAEAYHGVKPDVVIYDEFHQPAPKVTLSIVPPGEPSNEN